MRFLDFLDCSMLSCSDPCLWEISQIYRETWILEQLIIYMCVLLGLLCSTCYKFDYPDIRLYASPHCTATSLQYLAFITSITKQLIYLCGFRVQQNVEYFVLPMCACSIRVHIIKGKVSYFSIACTNARTFMMQYICLLMYYIAYHV